MRKTSPTDDAPVKRQRNLPFTSSSPSPVEPKDLSGDIKKFTEILLYVKTLNEADKITPRHLIPPDCHFGEDIENKTLTRYLENLGSLSFSIPDDEFEKQSKDIKEQLDRNGYIVIKNLCDRTSCHRALFKIVIYWLTMPLAFEVRQRVADIFIGILKRNTKEGLLGTVLKEEALVLKELFPMTGGTMMMSLPPSFHLPMHSELKSNKGLYSLFKKFINTEEDIEATVDRVSFKPPGTGESEVAHIDCNPLHTKELMEIEDGKCPYYQGFLCVSDKSFFCCNPGTHTRDFRKRMEASKAYSSGRYDQIVVDKEKDPLGIIDGVIKVPLNAGDFVVFSIFLMHVVHKNETDYFHAKVYLTYYDIISKPLLPALRLSLSKCKPLLQAPKMTLASPNQPEELYHHVSEVLTVTKKSSDSDIDTYKSLTERSKSTFEAPFCFPGGTNTGLCPSNWIRFKQSKASQRFLGLFNDEIKREFSVPHNYSKGNSVAKDIICFPKQHWSYLDMLEIQRRKIGANKQCCICLDINLFNGLLKLSPCQHACLCIKCFFQLAFKKDARSACPLCQQYVKNVLFDQDAFQINNYDKIIVAPLVDDNMSIAMFQAVESFFQELKKKDNLTEETETCISLLNICTRFVGKEKFDTSCLGLPLITIEQSEKILSAWNVIKPKQAFTVEKVIVAMCREPWKIGKHLARAGLCYHGNFGDSPDSIKEALEIVLSNWSCMYNRDDFYFHNEKRILL